MILILLFKIFYIKFNLSFDILTIRKNNQISTIEEKLNIQTSYKESWNLEIPKINLKADIKEGTSDEILNFYIGHFENTEKLNGNIGLAAHNRGYNVNYFERIKELEIGDLIYYKINSNLKIYKIDTKTIIKDTDWTVLENTNENKITLITCVEDMPEYRRCIQGIEMEEI